MIKAAHNLNEVTALVKEAIANGYIYEMDGISFVTHQGRKHIADLYINGQGDAVLRTYVGSKTEFTTFQVWG